MPRIRFTISGLMGLIVVAAIGFAGMREGTEIWASLTYTVTVLSLLMALPFLFYSQGKTRAGWLGFVLFSWVYLYFAFGSWWADGPGLPPLPTKWLLSFVHDQIHAKPQYVPNPNFPARSDAFLQSANNIRAPDHQTRNDLLDGRRATLSPGRALPAGPCIRRLRRILVSVRLFVTVQSADATGPDAAVTN